MIWYDMIWYRIVSDYTRTSGANTGRNALCLDPRGRPQKRLGRSRSLIDDLLEDPGGDPLLLHFSSQGGGGASTRVPPAVLRRDRATLRCAFPALRRCYSGGRRCTKRAERSSSSFVNPSWILQLSGVPSWVLQTRANGSLGRWTATGAPEETVCDMLKYRMLD